MQRIVIVLALLAASGAHAGPSERAAMDIAEMARQFCRQTPTGQSYRSFRDCMDYQLEGAKALQRAIHAGGRDRQVMECLEGARYDGPVDLAAAGLCVNVLR